MSEQVPYVAPPNGIEQDRRDFMRDNPELYVYIARREAYKALDSAGDLISGHHEAANTIWHRAGVMRQGYEAMQRRERVMNESNTLEFYSADCWLCEGLGGIALHIDWSKKRGKPLWTAHAFPSSDDHETRPCPVCGTADKDGEATPSLHLCGGLPLAKRRFHTEETR